MTDALADGRIRAWCLGLGADPLTFAMDLLAVVVIDAPLYDELFGDLVPTTPRAGCSSRGRSTSRRSRNCSPAPLQAARSAAHAGARAQEGPARRVTAGRRGLPAAGAPFRQVRAFGAERGVLAVPG